MLKCAKIARDAVRIQGKEKGHKQMLTGGLVWNGMS